MNKEETLNHFKIHKDYKNKTILIDILKYINSLEEYELVALNIAITELESSFLIEKTIGFLDFNKKSQ